MINQAEVTPIVKRKRWYRKGLLPRRREISRPEWHLTKTVQFEMDGHFCLSNANAVMWKNISGGVWEGIVVRAGVTKLWESDFERHLHTCPGDTFTCPAGRITITTRS